MIDDNCHAAAPAALGFYFQSFFGLQVLVGLTGDDGAVAIESADDVDLKDNGQRLLFQLKHSLQSAPAPITISSKGLWRTLKAWIDILPSVALSDTRFHLVTVAPIKQGSVLAVLETSDENRRPLTAALIKEAERVVAERQAAAAANKPLPHADRAAGCEAFLNLTADDRLNLMRQTRIRPGSIPIDAMEGEIAKKLTLIRPDDRAGVARRLIEWWDRQVVYSLCRKRPKFITRGELQQQITELIGDIEQDRLTADFETIAHPSDYQPDGMLTRQIRLVDGQSHDLSKAIREEWKARQQRSKWINDRPQMAAKIAQYDYVLKEYWSDEHVQIVESCLEVEETEKRSRGLGLLRWANQDAPTTIRPILAGFEAPYYIRGSYQVLAIDREVGWHPDYATLLADDPK
ncbi:MAG TPA: ABC-three component system protein [Sphingomonas sanguinis]|uniref:ABC-three component system protein n=1 Tax=Sphingomonas sanguinis TaxID=33051 RepID=UPI002AC14914|nr:ABC-three component system protein [Sphingomonas sanguinis]